MKFNLAVGDVSGFYVDPSETRILLTPWLSQQDVRDFACTSLNLCMYRGDVMASTPAPCFPGICRTDRRRPLPLVRLNLCLDEKSTLSGNSQHLGRDIVHHLVRWNVVKGKKRFPTIVSVYWLWQTRKVANTAHTSPRRLCRLKCSLCSFLPSLCTRYLWLSLFMCSSHITGLWGPSHTRQTWMRCFFPLIKTSAQNIFLRSFWILWRFTLALPAPKIKLKKHCRHTMEKRKTMWFA